ncbi:signal recognition particle-docking protein FtsY [Marivita sp. XM-24bin2]|uniref:signal recognition particle-docking protein FtsY n=1 Tax=unclassified Marivita TaxID=2632480 RepID=UPI000D794038|nr:signal recognition particle-docking protein FtsY [Marivita sp. XM-24bin2]PWL35198.1 MAG: signal recognition particle-docking protein FtsY [Marivita sp. XM-24bin2]
MSFFGKLKSKLFKSSSKLDEGLDAIVSDGGEETPTPEVPQPSDPEPQTPPSEPEPETPPPDVPSPESPEEVPEPDLPEQEPDEPREVPPPDLPEPDRPEEVPQPDLPGQDRPETPGPDMPAPEPTPISPPAPPSEAPQPSDPAPAPLREVQPAAPMEVPVQSVGLVEKEPLPEVKKPGLLGRLLGRSSTPTEIRRELDDDMLEQLEELLIQADMGVDTSLRVTANIAEGRFGKKLSVREIKELLAGEVARIMDPVAKPMPLYPTKPQVVLVVGVNGSGKTTTIGKLASQFRSAGKNVVIAAGDTFRAAAVEQLQVWGDRAGVPVLTAAEGSDPASLAFDAMTKAQAEGADLLMIDTAGRLQNRADLMEELAKIVRVIRKKDPDAPHNTLLVLDATTGQNALSQVETFQKLADVSGLVMTKLDGTAKGGVLVALADKFGLPIHAIGVGEQIDDLQPFDPEEFAAALTGLGAE